MRLLIIAIALWVIAANTCKVEKYMRPKTEKELTVEKFIMDLDTFTYTQN